MEILLTPKQTPANEKQMIEDILTENNLKMRLAENYKRAIEELARFKNPIVFLYCVDDATDLKPAEAVRIMKEIVPNLLIVAISQDTSLETDRELRKSGIYFHLSSPFGESELRDVLAGAIRKEIMGRKK